MKHQFYHLSLSRLRAAAVAAIAVLAAFSARADVEINETNFPDAKFQHYIKYLMYLDNYDAIIANRADLEADGYEFQQVNVGTEEVPEYKLNPFHSATVLTDLALSLITDINLDRSTDLDHVITDLTGVRNFTNLERLFCDGHNLTSLDVHGLNKLQVVEAHDNNITSVNFDECHGLRSLYLYHNKLSREEITEKLICGLHRNPHDGEIYARLHLYNSANTGNSNHNADIPESVVQALTKFGWEITDGTDDDGFTPYTGIEDDIVVAINYVNFPDNNFRKYLTNYVIKYDDNNKIKDADGIYLSEYFPEGNPAIDGKFTEGELLYIRSIQLLTSKARVSNLTGVKYFTHLQRLKFDWSNVYSLDLSDMKNLRELDASFNKITSINVTGCTSLVDVNVAGNKLDVPQARALVEQLPSIEDNSGLLKVHNFKEDGTVTGSNNFTKTVVDLAKQKGWAVKQLNRTTNKWSDYEGSSNMAFYVDERNFPDKWFRNYIMWRAWNDNRSLFDEEASKEGGYNVYEKHGVPSGSNPLGSGEIFEEDVQFIRRLYLNNWSGDYTPPADSYETDRLMESLEGIKLFTSLEQLYVGEHKLKNLDVSGMPNLRIVRAQNQLNKLESLNIKDCPELWQVYAQGNDLKGLDLSNTPKLGQLVINNNRNIGQIDVTKCPELFWFDCFNCMQPAIDVTQNPKLETLYCYETRDNEAIDATTAIAEDATKEVSGISSSATINGNGTTRRGLVTELDLTHNPLLKELRCSNNPLTDLDLSANTNLEILYCNSIDMQATVTQVEGKPVNMLLKNLPGLSKLKRLSCYNANLDSLNVSNNPALWELVCYKNNIWTLDLSQNANLTYLSTGEIEGEADANNARTPNGGNYITTLDVSNNTLLETLHCCDMRLTDLDLRNNTALKDLDYTKQYRRIQAERTPVYVKAADYETSRQLETHNLYYFRLDDNADDDSEALDGAQTLQQRIAVTDRNKVSNFVVSRLIDGSWSNGTKIEGSAKSNPRRIVATTDDVKPGSVYGNILMFTGKNVSEDLDAGTATGGITYKYDVNLPEGVEATDKQTEFTLDWYSDPTIITAVDDITAADTIDSVTYVNVTGQTSTTPWTGINLVITRYTNGTSTTEKRLF